MSFKRSKNCKRHPPPQRTPPPFLTEKWHSLYIYFRLTTYYIIPLTMLLFRDKRENVIMMIHCILYTYIHRLVIGGSLSFSNKQEIHVFECCYFLNGIFYELANHYVFKYCVIVFCVLFRCFLVRNAVGTLVCTSDLCKYFWYVNKHWCRIYSV